MADQDFNIKVVTTADTTGIKQTSAELEKLKQQQATFAATQARILDKNRAAAIARDKPPPVPTEADEASAIPSAALRVYAAEVAAAGVIINAVRVANEEQRKLFDELEKESAKLSEITHKWNEVASATDSEADAIRLVTSTLPALEQAHSKVLQIQRAQLSFNQAGIQGVSQLLNLYSRALGLPAFLDSNTYQKSLDQIKGAYTELEKMAEDNAAFNFQTSKALEETWNADKLRPYTEVISELQRKIGTMRELMGGLNTKTAEGRALWAQYGREVEQDEAHLKEILRLQEQSTKAQEKAVARERSFITGSIQSSSSQTQDVIKNELAAQQARAAGREKDADLFEKSAAQLEKSMTPEQRAELEGLRKATSKPVGRKAGEGESQELVDQTERNRINFERQLKGQPPLADRGKDSGLVDAMKQALDETMSRYWGP